MASSPATALNPSGLAAAVANTGRYKLIEQCLEDEIRYMFGNPGTVEEGFLDAMQYFPRFTYIATLQEGVAVGVADGYARTTHKPALVQLHDAVGLANGISLLYQAKRGHSPLVVIGGEAGLPYQAMDAQNAANLVDIARPVVKYATQVVHAGSVLRTFRRAVKMAATPPMGPVFISLPLDILDAVCPERVVRTQIPDTRVAPDASAIAEAAQRLLGSRNPLIIVGDGIAFSDAQEDLIRVARFLGATVYGADSSEPNYPADDPLYGGLLGHMWGSSSSEKTSKGDAVLVVGTYLFPEVFPALEGVFMDGAQVICVDLDLYEMGKNFPFTLGLMADPKRTLAALARELELLANDDFREAAGHRRQAAEEKRRAERTDEASAAKQDSSDGVSMKRFCADLASRLSEQRIPALIFDEAITNSDTLCRHIPPSTPGTYLQTRGGSLGVGIPGAIGAKLAKPESTVIGFTGDGGAMYTIQALWTAAHHKIGAKFVICNNRSYKLLKTNIDRYWEERSIPARQYPGCFDIGNPDLRFDLMSESMGVEAIRVTTNDKIRSAIDAMFSESNRSQPLLVDLLLAG